MAVGDNQAHRKNTDHGQRRNDFHPRSVASDEKHDYANDQHATAGTANHRGVHQLSFARTVAA
ncbi:hypothetical protein A5755_13105 [Mycolicibacterium fortuitum]|nr:hypothetical protein A5763_14160 [Mycolicibacterium fortuitum]OBB40851.1 hypothetical protein A5754_19980 [Mycolicibacterium fortuitum]OBB76689.1 hypothetical protein A5755_13105 [Mycolicibacterium fortuitum]OBF82078.1 hypothetical protein A5751_14465 [Mycolicibacterium fortuitum]OBG16282.1 hypothetical protein A5768_06225 [Mycolicibacterium fortuitum]